MRFSWKISTAALLLATAASAAGTDSDALIQDLVDWVLSKNGFVNPKLDITSDGFSANAAIEKNEVLLNIPPECIISVASINVLDKDDDEEDEDEDEGSTGLNCGVARFIIKEIKEEKESSDYAPYIKYIQSLPTGIIPSSWSEEGQDLIDQIVADRLPPVSVTGWSYESCRGGSDEDELGKSVAMKIVEHCYEDQMIPLYDMMDHSNGDDFNAEGRGKFYPGRNFKVVAKKAIEAGSPIKTSYNLCRECLNVEGAWSYGTPELFRDAGIIEPYPQRWRLGKYAVVFEISQEEDGTYTVVWDALFPELKGVTYMNREVKRLEKMKEKLEASSKDDNDDLVEDIPEYELKKIGEYLDAAIIAFSHAVKAAKGEVFATLSEDYHPLDFEDYGLTYHGQETFPGYNDIDSDKSAYQSMDFWHNPETKDTCFDLDNTVQICGGYRPHYHEPFVHYPARFLDRDVKRIAFIGGGDNMLLHEALKYPSIELVLGLEIDQKVSRNSFKHFGTQTHFDSDKVQWWYGDAAKSLLVLPKEYFGSFDLVLVDLSETIMALTVNENLDIFDALGLLLREDGILVKNEMYLDQFSRIWEYSSMIHYLSPQIGSQALVFGSNKIDFLHKEVKDHDGIENLFLKTLDDSEDVYELLHDYRKNHTREIKHCAVDLDLETVPDVQDSSPGILMIIEAEDTTVEIDSSDKLVSTITKSLEKVGFTILSSATYDTKEEGSIVVASVTFKEGYVVARSWPEHRYVAFDLHLWGSFEKHEGAKKVLLESFGSTGDKSSSSYRIVAGGMFGVDTWKDDAKNRGPRITQGCDTDSEAVPRDAAMDASIVASILKDSMALVPDDNIMVLVVCGEDEEFCTSIDTVKKASNVDLVVPLTTCPDLPAESDKEDMRACEKKSIEYLKEVTKEKKIHAIIIDPTAQKRMGQIVHRIFMNEWNQDTMLVPDDKLLAVAPMVNGQGADEMWRRELLDRFRQDVVFNEPVFLVETVYNTTDSTVKFPLMSSGDFNLVTHLNQLTTDIENRVKGIVADTTYIQGGQWYVPPHDPKNLILPDRYDQTEPLANWNSQKPVGHQTVFQFEVSQDKVDDDATVLSCDSLMKGLQESVAAVKEIAMKGVEFHEYSNVGNGCWIVGLWSGGTVSVLWDGNFHLDLNTFLNIESTKAHQEFKDLFSGHFPFLQVVLHDEQPRGYGRVISFQKDLVDFEPHWAFAVIDKKEE